MRRMRTGVVLCLILLLVPIYLWKVQGWWSGEGGDDARPHKAVDPNADRVVYSPIDLGDAKRGIVAGAELSGIDPIELLARTDPVELLRECLRKYQAVKGYTCVLCKHERVKGKLNAPEVIEAWFKEEPYSVMMRWKEGAGLAAASLYVAGENDNKMCVRPAAKAAKLLGFVKNAPDSSEAKSNTRYLITEFGLRCGTERTYKAWRALRDKGAKLDIEYLGLIKNIPEAGGRDCYVITRKCDPPEEEGLTQVTIYIDAETWFQVGSILKAGDDLIGSYWFKDIRVNPSFDENRFKPETLKQY